MCNDHRAAACVRALGARARVVAQRHTGGGVQHDGSAAESAVALADGGDEGPEQAGGSDLAAGTALPVQQVQRRQSKTVV